MQPICVKREHGVTWIEVILHVEGEEIVEGLGNFFLEQGSGGIVIEEGPVPSKTVLRAFFLNDPTAKGKISRLKTYIGSLKALFPERSITSLSFQPLDDNDWVQAYRESYRGARITDRIDIKPSWDGERKRGEEIVIEIDPGMAFGTGLHPSTRLCLQALEERLNDLPPTAEMRVLDVGTGSGILAIAAAKMGARDVLAIDIDPMAATVAMENIARNGCEDKVKVVAGDITGIKGRFELIVANITERVHEENTVSYWRRLEKRGCLILSGIIKEREGKLFESYTAKGFYLMGKMEMEDWSTLIFEKEGIA